VQNYSTRKLTYPSDRLPALSGIASEFEKLFPLESYTMGIWKDDSHCDLLWMDDKRSEPPAQRPDWSQVPSWSWASLNKPVLWHPACLPDRGYDASKTLQACNIVEAEDSQLQQLILSGYLLTVSGDYEKYPFAYHSAAGTITYEVMGLSFRYISDMWYSALVAIRSVSVIQSTYIMPVLYYEHDSDERRNQPGVLGLLLIRAENSGNGVFRRVGMVNVFGYDAIGGHHRTVVPDEFPAAVRQFQRTLRQDDYIEYDGESTYTIAII
jgi:hypothetical protein